MTENIAETEEPLTLPLAPVRGVVERANGIIADSYGTQYIRDIGNGMLHRITPKKPKK